MYTTIAAAILIPFFGTSLGAGTALLLKNRLPDRMNRLCGGFAAGVMTAASVWSLLIPAIEQSLEGAKIAFLAVPAGFVCGILTMIGTERAVDTLYRRRKNGKGGLSGAAFMMLAVTLHHVPEGLAVGVACAGLTGAAGALSPAGVAALAMGVALQNIPEGAIISLPLLTAGKPRGRAFWAGVLSGAVEPVAALCALLAAAPVIRLMPFFLSFAAGAMLYVTVQELIPEAVDDRSHEGSVSFCVGFALMMVMDVLL